MWPTIGLAALLGLTARLALLAAVFTAGAAWQHSREPIVPSKPVMPPEGFTVTDRGDHLELVLSPDCPDPDKIVDEIRRKQMEALRQEEGDGRAPNGRAWLLSDR